MPTVDFALEENERRISEIETLITRQEVRIARLQQGGRVPAISARRLLKTYRAALENARTAHRRLLQSR
jgi:hypothetical protein